MPGIWLWRGRREEEASQRYLTVRRVCNKLFNLTGFRGKTLWDLMGLLIVPLVILGATWVLNYFEGEREEKRADALRKADIERANALQEIENDRVQQSVLQSYIKDMTELLLHEGLAASKPEQPIRDIARSSTIAAVRQLDGSRKGILLRFLYESDLIYEKEFRLIPELIINPITALKDADLTNVHLNGAILSDADLNGAFLSLANLSKANLTNANLTNTHLNDAILSDADLNGAHLNSAFLSRAFLSLANLSKANLTNAQLNGAILSGADLSRAVLSRAVLSRAFLSLADLRGTNLTNAHLNGAILSATNLSLANLRSAKGWTNEQLLLRALNG
jgi:uncharacterized protein YjbI with pentapeptide repeats